MLLNFMHPSNIGKTIIITNTIANNARSTNEEVIYHGEFFELALFFVGIIAFMVVIGLKKI